MELVPSVQVKTRVMHARSFHTYSTGNVVGKTVDPLGSTPIDESGNLKKDLVKAKAELEKMTTRAKRAENRATAVQNQLASLRAENNSLRSNRPVRSVRGDMWRERSSNCLTMHCRLPEMRVQRSRKWRKNCWRREFCIPPPFRISRL